MKSALLAVLLCCFAQSALANMAPFDPNDPRYKRHGDEAAPVSPPEESSPPSDGDEKSTKKKVKDRTSKKVEPK